MYVIWTRITADILPLIIKQCNDELSLRQWSLVNRMMYHYASPILWHGIRVTDLTVYNVLRCIRKSSGSVLGPLGSRVSVLRIGISKNFQAKKLLDLHLLFTFLTESLPKLRALIYEGQLSQDVIDMIVPLGNLTSLSLRIGCLPRRKTLN